MDRATKQQNIDLLKGKLSKAVGIVLADFRGVTVKNDTALRNKFREKGCEYRVVKNKLLGRAMKGSPMEKLEELLAGPTAIAYHTEDPSAPAKVATEIAKAEQKFVIKGGFVDGKTLDVKGVEALSRLPGKDELRATFLATLQAVPQNFLRLLTAAQQNFVFLLAAKEREGGGEQK